MPIHPKTKIKKIHANCKQLFMGHYGQNKNVQVQYITLFIFLK